jgi:hypothetical protein
MSLSRSEMEREQVVGEQGPMKGIPQPRPSECWIIAERALYVRSTTLSGVRATVAPTGVVVEYS